MDSCRVAKDVRRHLAGCRPYSQLLRVAADDFVDAEAGQCLAVRGENRAVCRKTVLFQKLREKIRRFSPERTDPPLITLTMKMNARVRG